MFRAFLFLLVVLAVAAAGAWFADEPGSVTLAWRDWRIETSAALLAAAVVVVAVAAALAYRAWRAMVAVPGRIGSAWTTSKRRRGYLALTRGMVAVAAGDEREAAKQAGKARVLLHDPPLTLLLEAQAAQLQGDDRAAETYFTAMLDRPDMEFLGLRGLLGQAMGRGDTARALELARRAQALKPKSQWVADQLFRLETQSGDWTGAQATLKAAERRHLIGTDKGRRHRTVLAHMESERLAAATPPEPKAAMKQAKKAFDLMPDFVPGAQHYAALLVAAGKLRRARGVLEAAWAKAPHPDLVPLYVKAREADDALATVRALEQLAKQNPDHDDSRLMLGRAALDAELWGEARRYLVPLVSDGRDPSGSVCRLMARLAAGDGSPEEERAWLERAARAPADPAWVCGACGNTLDAWAAACARCGGFDTFTYGPAPHVTAPHVTESLAAAEIEVVSPAGMLGPSRG